MAYNVNPLPQSYSPIYGGIPGAVDLPNPYADLSGVLPDLGEINKAASGDVLSQLQGQLSPGTINLLQDQGAAWGVASGMPGSGLAQNRTLRNLGLTSENVVNQGLQNYSRILPTASSTQTVSPALQSSIAERNATMRSAPNPAAAQSYAQQLFDQYLQSMKGPGGGTRGSMNSPAGGSVVGGTPAMPTSPMGEYSGFGTLTTYDGGPIGPYDPSQQDLYWMGYEDPSLYGGVDLGGDSNYVDFGEW